MKLGDIETLIWLIIGAVVLIAKGWSKLQGQINQDSSESEETPPVVRPKLQRPRPQQQRPAPVGARPVPPRAEPMQRTTQPVQRTTALPRTARPPVGSPPPREAWRVDPEQIRRFMEQLSGQPRPTPPPHIAQPPVQKAEAPAPPPTRATPEPTPAVPATEPVKASPPATTSRSALWAEALRDRQNIRNIIISAEIIGPPKALR